MKRLPFVLPEWTRIAWASDRARAVWEPRISRIARAWEEVERLAVADGVKPSTLQSCAPETLASLVSTAAQRGTVVLPLGQVGSLGTYTSSSVAPTAGQPWVYRVAVTRADLAADWATAWAKSDDPTIGRLLGFPACCREFFQKYWVRDRRVDTTYAMTDDRGGDVDGPANILWRWMGVRLVSHLPCSFGCRASAEISREMMGVGIRHGFAEEMGWAADVLSWPVEWSALHGIAEVRTPILRVSTRTDATADKLVVRYRGTGYPDEGASGTGFPFERRAAYVPLTSLRSYRSAFDPRDNGFSSEGAENAAHAVVRAAVDSSGAALDLGCGDGRLVRDIVGFGSGRAYGVEVDPARAARAKVRLTEVVVGPIANVDAWRGFDVDLTLVMPGRLLEMMAPGAAAVRDALRGRRLLVYAYGDWLTRFGSLEALTRAAGLDWNPTGPVRIGDGVQAVVIV